jgi:hypothetical protein
MSVDARKEDFEHIELFGKPALFSNSRIDRVTVPGNLYCYDLRGSDNDPGRPVTVENKVGVNHAGTVLAIEPVTIPEEGYKRLRGKINFLGEHIDIPSFCEEHGIEYLPDPRRFELRPASPDEAGLFYSQKEQDEALGTVGHMRFDHGHGGAEFWHTWWPHNGDDLNPPEFKKEFEAFVNEMREYGPLRNGRAMYDYCYSNAEKMDGGMGNSFGFIAESENYRYCLRCTPREGDYSYIYIYDKRQQELNMKSEEKSVIGIVSFASGETLAYTDPDVFLQVIRDELPYRPTSGFQYKVLTDDPAVRKGADDILYDLFGEENPRPLADYGLTEQGRKALRDAENPSLPHSYKWFVMENFGCDGETRHDTGSLTDAIDSFNGLACDEKRLCVTKDGVSTVYLAITHDGETHIDDGWQENPRFATDSTMDEAAARLKLSIAGIEPSGPTMTFGGM